MNELSIRAANEHDVSALVELGARTFAETYGHANDARDLAAYIADSYNEDVITAAMRDSQVSYLVAESGEQIIGFAKLVIGSREHGIHADYPAELSQLYVSADSHGRGLGRLLVEACADRAGRAGCDVLWLGVWDQNPNAIAFYERVGFRPVGTYEFMLGSDVQTDLLMSRTLTQGRARGSPAAST